MRIAGLDLAASAPNTAAAVLDDLEVVELIVGVDDERTLAITAGAAKIGVDCPLGWPRAFVEFVACSAAGGDIAAASTVLERDRLAYRDTDRWVREHHRPLRPLSVSADRIGHAALRCAALLPRLDPGLDRTGFGRVVETYPAGSLRVWGLPFRRYKGPPGTPLREHIVDALAAVVDFGRFRDRCVTSDHALDAVIAALTARAATSGDATLPTARELTAARAEGWIALPTCTLRALSTRRSMLQ